MQRWSPVCATRNCRKMRSSLCRRATAKPSGFGPLQFVLVAVALLAALVVIIAVALLVYGYVS